MIQLNTVLNVADNTGAKRVRCFRVLGQRKKYAYVGDIITYGCTFHEHIIISLTTALTASHVG